MFGALAAAHARLALDIDGTSPALAVVWVRAQRRGPLQFLVGGRPGFPQATQHDNRGGEQRHVPYPPGATGIPCSGDDVQRALEQLPSWVRCSGGPNTLWTDGMDLFEIVPRPNLDDAAACLDEPFAWVVVATPVPRPILDVFGEDSADVDWPWSEYEKAHRRQLVRARTTGVWDIRVLAGAGAAATAHAAAALLCGADDVVDRPFLLTPTQGVTDLTRAWTAPDTRTAAPGGASWPFIATTEFLAALARPPAQETNGLRTFATNTFATRAPDVPPDSFAFGRILDAARFPVRDLQVSRETLNRHTFICGATGSGKSQTVRSLLTALSTDAAPIPWLVIEPAKSEYARMAGRLGPEHRVTVIRPGDLAAAPASLNPLEPEPGFPLQSHVDLVRALFMAAFAAHEPFPQVLAQALNECYTASGWDLVTGEPRPAHKPKFASDDPTEARIARYPNLGDLQAAARRVVEGIGYGPRVAADVRGFVDVRIGSLREGAAGRFFDGGHPLDIANLLAGNVVIELESITNDQDKAFFLGAMLVRIVEHLRISHGSGKVPLRHVLVVEEAHRLLRNAAQRQASMAVELFASLLSEIRAYGEGVVVVEQIPGKIIPDVLKNSALKIVHRLPAADDRAAVGATMNLTRTQSDSLVALTPGYAAVSVDGMERPVLARMPHDEHLEDPRGAATEAPLRGRRSALCGALCQGSPCTLSTMNASKHHSLEPAPLVWVEAVATVQAMGMRPPAPSESVRIALGRLPFRDLECTLAYAVERAVEAREQLMRDEVEPSDFAARLLEVLKATLLGTDGPTEDPRRFAYGNYRYRDVLVAIAAARRTAPDGPHTYPADLVAAWARRGLVLTGTSGAEHRLQVRAGRGYAPDRVHARIGDVVRSGLLDAIVTLTGDITKEHVVRALRMACADDPGLKTIIDEAALRIALECARNTASKSPQREED